MTLAGCAQSEAAGCKKVGAKAKIYTKLETGTCSSTTVGAVWVHSNGGQVDVTVSKAKGGDIQKETHSLAPHQRRQLGCANDGYEYCIVSEN